MLREMRLPRWLRVVPVFTVAVVCAPTASAQLTIFTDRAAWEAALASFQTETFSIPDQAGLAPNTTHTLGAIDFSYAGIGTRPPAVLAGQFEGDVTPLDFGGGFSEPGPHTFTLPATVNAVGGDFVEADILTLTVGSEVAPIPANALGFPEFFGVISATPFTSFVIDAVGTRQPNDFFELDNLSFGTAASALSADFNGDGVVDLLDFDILAQNFGTTSGATSATGDTNGDGTVDLLDFDTLAGEFGSTSPATAPASIPEPASAALLGLAGPMLLRGRRRRRSA